MEISLLNIIKENVGSLIIAGVTIIGFFVTNHSMKKSFENELKKQRNDIALENMSKMPLEMLNLMNDMIAQGKDTGNKGKKLYDMTNRFNKYLNIIYSYGSANAIRIAAMMQKENFEKSELIESDLKNKYRVMSMYVLLATQIKYDVTGIAISAEEWFRMKINDYDKEKENLKNALNQLVTELSLDKKFKIY